MTCMDAHLCAGRFVGNPCNSVLVVGVRAVLYEINERLQLRHCLPVVRIVEKQPRCQRRHHAVPLFTCGYWGGISGRISTASLTKTRASSECTFLSRVISKSRL